MRFESLQFWTREALANVARNRLMSFLAVLTVTVGLFILGGFYITLGNLRAAARYETSKLDLVVMLKHDITPEERKAVVAAARIPQVASLKLVLRGQVLKDWQTKLSDMPLDIPAASNPLNDELHVNLRNPRDLLAVRRYLLGLPGVDSSPDDSAAMRAAAALLAVDHFLTVAGLVALVVLSLAILLIIHNAIRLTVYARRREIRIMELVGATQNFIRVPFLLEGCLYGLAGAALAAIALYPLAAMAQAKMVALGSGVPARVPLSCFALMLAAGLTFGLVASWFSLSQAERAALAQVEN